MAVVVENREKGKKRPKARLSATRRALIITSMLSLMAVLLAVSPKVARAAGGGSDVPEIDPGSMAGTLTLLVGGVLALTDRVRRISLK